MVNGSWLKDGWGPGRGPGIGIRYFGKLNPYIGVPTSPKIPEIMKIEVWGFSNNKTEKSLIQNEAE